MSTDQNSTGDDLYFPKEEILKDAHVGDWEAQLEAAQADYLGFWEARAKELEWYQEWNQVLDDSSPPFFKWFAEGKTKIILNALDRHQDTWRRNKLALIWEGEPGDVRTFSYHALNSEVRKFANILKNMGAKKNGRVTI